MGSGLVEVLLAIACVMRAGLGSYSARRTSREEEELPMSIFHETKAKSDHQSFMSIGLDDQYWLEHFSDPLNFGVPFESMSSLERLGRNNGPVKPKVSRVRDNELPEGLRKVRYRANNLQSSL